MTSCAGDVVFMWQPAEETTAGAKVMIEEGLLEAAGRPVDAAYCLHVMAAGHPRGTWISRPGPDLGRLRRVQSCGSSASAATAPRRT